MDFFREIHALGQRLAQNCRRMASAEGFAQLAADELRQWRAEAAMPSSAEWAGFLGQTEHRQNPDLAFSNLPVTLFRTQEFYLEVLVWTTSSTLIHDHAFSGAFRVLAGSSLHSTYRFTQQAEFGAFLRRGELARSACETLRVGDVRIIGAGRDGLLHSLFHLDNPSMTLVVRTPVLPWCRPELAYHRAGVAHAAGELGADDRCRMLLRLFATWRQIDRNAAFAALLEGLDGLDAPRAFAVSLRLHRELRGPEREQVEDRLRACIGPESDCFVAALHEAGSAERIAETRGSVTDPELLYFLAALMTSHLRSEVVAAMRARDPSLATDAALAKCLSRLGSADTVAHAAPGMPLAFSPGSPLLTALRVASGQWIDRHGDTPPWEAVVAQANCHQTADQQSFRRSIRAIPELAALWRS